MESKTEFNKNGDMVKLAGEEEAANLISMVKEKCKKDSYELFLKALVDHKQDMNKTTEDTCEKICNILCRHPDIISSFNSFLEPHDLYKRYEDEKVTPTYRKRLTEQSQMGQETSDVINNTYACVPKAWKSPKDKTSFYEKCANKVEDEMFEADMQRNSLETVISKAEELLSRIGENRIEKEKGFLFEDYFTPVDLACIKKFNGEFRLEKAVSWTDATRMLSMIKMKLMKRKLELMRSKDELKGEWAKRLANACPVSRLKMKRKRINMA